MRTRKRRMTRRSRGAEGYHFRNPSFGQGACSCWCLIAANSLPYSRYSVENAFFDEKEDTCAALGEISVNTR